MFRNGHPTLYPSSEPIEMADIEAWIYRTTQAEPLPRGSSDDATSVRMLEAQATAEERIKEIQKAALAAEEDLRRSEQERQVKARERQRKRQEEEERQQRSQTMAEEMKAVGGSGGAASGASGASASSGASADASGGRKLQEAQGGPAAQCAALSDGLSDSSFEKVVMDKAKDVFVLFYHHSDAFCAGNGTQYAGFATKLTQEGLPAVVATHMDVRRNKSPFVFEEVCAWRMLVQWSTRARDCSCALVAHAQRVRARAARRVNCRWPCSSQPRISARSSSTRRSRPSCCWSLSRSTARR